ncbi:MAG: DegT/DnrJ/EryC1/StrS aminotransferase family protein [Chloroflexota bacterium]
MAIKENQPLEQEQGGRETFLPFALPTIGEAEVNEVVDSLQSGWVTTGPKVKRFEAAIASYVGASHAIAVSACTTGLHIALAALEIGPGDEVIVPTMTFCATANVVVHLGAKPVLVDVGLDHNIDISSFKAAITERTKAVMPVHYGGQACNLEAVYEIANQHNLAVIEDGAHAIGTTYRNHYIGSDSLKELAGEISRITVFSFYATKNMTTGEGGMITTDREDLAQKMRVLTLHGMSRDAWKRYTSAGSWYYEVVAAGFKSNMTDIQAALGIHQLERLDKFIEKRQVIAAVYDEAFRDMPELITPVVHEDRNLTYHLYVLRLNPEALTIDRGEFIEALKERKIGTSVHYIPVHLHPFYQDQHGYQRGDLPVSEALYDNMFSLPIYPRMTHQDIEDTINAVREIVRQNQNKSL